jgi:hypothetical protein
MRALCGAIITAGALIGLGLTALGFGMRYSQMSTRHDEGTFNGVFYGAPPMIFMLVLLVVGLVIGLGIAFIGLAYHHERRHRERLHYETRGAASAGTQLPT